MQEMMLFVTWIPILNKTKLGASSSHIRGIPLFFGERLAHGFACQASHYIVSDCSF